MKSSDTDAHADQSNKAQDLQGDLHFDIKSFAYPDEKDIPVLRHRFHLKTWSNFRFSRSCRCCKTTIIQLLLKEFDQYDGEITLNGINIKKIPLSFT